MPSSVGSLTCNLNFVQVLIFWTSVVYTVTVEDLQNLKDEVSAIQKEHAKLTEEVVFLKRENNKLWSEINHLSGEVKDIQQYSRVDNVEISGIPQVPDENLYEVLKKVCLAIGVEYNRNEISEAHRLPATKQGHPFIIVRFISRRYRDQWLSAAKATVGNVQQIYPDLPSAPFYINQHLTSYKKGLLDMAKRLVTEGVYTYAWVKDGKIYVRKTPTSRVIRVKTYVDFDHDIDNYNTSKPT